MLFMFRVWIYTYLLMELRNREGFLVDHLHASWHYIIIQPCSIQRNGRRWCPSSVCWVSFVTLVTLGKNPWWIWRSVQCGYGPGPGDKWRRYHNREGIHIPGWKRKIIDSKVTTGMGYVGSQEGNFSHIIGVSDKIRGMTEVLRGSWGCKNDTQNFTLRKVCTRCHRCKTDRGPP